MNENHKIAIGFSAAALLASGCIFFGKYIFHIPGTSISYATLKANCLALKLKEDEANAKIAVQSRASFNAMPAWWKDSMLGKIGVSSGVDATNLTAQQWQLLVDNINTYQSNITSTYSFTDLIHNYPDALGIWLNEIPGITDPGTASAFILKNF